MGETSKINILLDTDVLINIANASHPDAYKVLGTLNSLEENGAKIYISCITEMEFIQGSKSQLEKNRLINMLKAFDIIYITQEISLLARDLIYDYSCSSNGLLLADALIAATAIQNELTFLTFNTKHFKFINELKMYSLLQK